MEKMPHPSAGEGDKFQRKMNVDIICLQEETHIKTQDKKYLVNKRGSGILEEEFISVGQKKTNGIVFYIKPQFKPKNIIK